MEGASPVKVKQISVFLENKSGRLAKITKVLNDNKINIRALSIADTADFGILRLIVNQPDNAMKVLRNEEFAVSETEVIALGVPDHPGGLAGILEILDNTGNNEKPINIEYIYAFVGRSGKDAVVVFRVEEIERALSVLTKAGVRILSDTEVYAF